MRIRKLIFGIVGIFFLYTSHANISVSPIIVDLTEDGADSTEIAVKNFDKKQTAYVEVTSFRIESPGTPSSKKIRIHDPQKEGLLSFPAKLALLPGQTQYVRVVRTISNLNKDEVYEVDFVPKVVSQYIEKKSSNGPTIGIRVIIGYGARVTARPKKIIPLIVAKRLKDQLIIKNTGNTQLKIASCVQNVKGKEVEVPLPAYTLYAGNSIKQKLNHNLPVKLEVLVMDKRLGTFRTG